MHEPFDPSSLEPREVWRAFLELSAIPRPSHHEGAASAWALSRLRGAGLEAEADASGNVVARRRAKPGREAAPPLILQAHLDMVPQKEPSVSHDFLLDPIRPRLDPADPGWLRATGTTLGADNGIGLACALALIEDPGLDCGPLELLLTVNEEDGMTGARDLAPDALRGRLLLNFDGEAEGELGMGSAGSRRLFFTFGAEATEAPQGLAWRRVRVAGLLGGHSGGDIHLGRGNAIKVLAGLLAPLAGGEFRLASMSGGSVANAIPREAEALVGIAPAGLEVLLARLSSLAAGAKGSLVSVDPGLRVEVEASPPPLVALDTSSSGRVLRTLEALPNGLRSLLEGRDDVARLSSNLGAVETRVEGEGPVSRIALAGKVLVRAAFDAEKEALVAELRSVLEGGGAEVTYGPAGNAWQPDPKSRLLALAREVWSSVDGVEPPVRATHGGLECNIFRGSHPDWDMLSAGPTIRFPHSPDEAVEIASVGRFYEKARLLVERVGREGGR